MKKIFPYFITMICMAFAMTSCSDDDDDNGSGGSGAAQVTVGSTSYSLGNAYWYVDDESTNRTVNLEFWSFDKLGGKFPGEMSYAAIMIDVADGVNDIPVGTFSGRDVEFSAVYKASMEYPEGQIQVWSDGRGGTVEISKEGDSYIIEVKNMSVEDTETEQKTTASLSFKGRLRHTTPSEIWGD